MALDPNSMEKVNIFINAENLAKVPNFSNTDPFAVMYFKDIRTNVLERVGNTEVVMDTVNPHFATSLTVDYLFEVVQEITIRAFHCEGKSKPLTDESKHTFLGEVTFTLSELMRKSAIQQNVKGGKNQGSMTIRAEAQVNTRDLFCVTFSGNKLANKDGFFGTSDPFLEISRINEDNNYNVVWKGNKIDNTLNPRWGEVKIPMVTLCNGDLDRPLRIQVWDYNSNGKHKSMGVVQTSARAMLTNSGVGMDVIEADRKAKSKSYVNSGFISATNTRVEHYPTFSEFIQGGCEINMIVAIDFTGSNGDPRSSDSLHYIDPTGRLNSYQNAILSVGRVLEPYDSDKMYPVYGFGARVRLPSGEFSPVQHCFPVYGGGAEVAGIDGILKAYKECLNVVMLSGPTLFGPLVAGAHFLANSSQCSQNNQKYTILLILTDGVINDLDSTIDAVIGASREPMSIVIIGVGTADFSEMSALDSDKELLKHNGQTATRDIVQFVPYREAASRGPAVLAQQVLAEIPNQFLKYMEQHNIVPNKKQ